MTKKQTKKTGKEKQAKSQETLPAIYGEKLPEIPEETLEMLRKTAERNTLLASVQKDGGFEVKNAWFEALTGVMVAVDPYLVKWERKEPHRIPYKEDELDWPENYKPGCDVTIVNPERIRIKFSLSKSSFQYELCDYIKFLDSQGLRPHEVVTRFTTRQVNGQFGTYTIVVPSLVDGDDGVVDLSAPQSIPENDQMPEDSDVPF